MAFWVYGDDIVTNEPRDPLFFETKVESEARAQAAREGMQVQEVEIVAARAQSNSPARQPTNLETQLLRRLATGILSVALLTQALAVAAAVFLPFGFDHPSTLCLDFKHLIALLGVCCFSVLIGIMISIAQRRWMILTVQLIAVFVIFASLLV